MGILSTPSPSSPLTHPILNFNNTLLFLSILKRTIFIITILFLIHSHHRCLPRICFSDCVWSRTGRQCRSENGNEGTGWILKDILVQNDLRKVLSIRYSQKYTLMKRCRIWPSKWSPSLIYHRIKTTHPTVWPQTFFGLATPYSPILQWCWYSYTSCHGDENHCATSIFILHILISSSTLSSPGVFNKILVILVFIHENNLRLRTLVG